MPWNLAVERGEFVALVGANGSGKTTLLRVLLGLLPRDAGEIRWNEQRVEDAGVFFTPPVSAYTAQVPRLFTSEIDVLASPAITAPASST